MEAGKNIAITFEQWLELLVGQFRFGFNIDQEEKFRTAGMNSAPVAANAPGKRIQIEVDEIAFRPKIPGRMSNEDKGVGGENVGFHGAKTEIQGIEQRPGMLIVIVGEAVAKQLWSLGGRARYRSEQASKGDRQVV